jgi:hypothetical protein
MSFTSLRERCCNLQIAVSKSGRMSRQYVFICDHDMLYGKQRKQKQKFEWKNNNGSTVQLSPVVRNGGERCSPGTDLFAPVCIRLRIFVFVAIVVSSFNAASYCV